MWNLNKGTGRFWDVRICLLLVVHYTVNIVLTGSDEIWPLERPNGMPTIVSLEVMCGKDHMDVQLTFSHPFEGIVSSKGQHSDPKCVYVPPSTGKTFFSFRISYSHCGTKPDLHGQFYENTIVVQYDKDLLEVWDEAKRLRCEWFNDYEKTASKPPMVIADLDVIQLDFRGDNVDCWMEIQHGKGPWAPPVSGIVPLGSTLTLVVAINDYRGEFDMRVKSCVASNGAGHVIKLSDEFGCVLRPKMISRFLKARAPDERATVITYSFFHAFKFPDALSVYINCKVEICRNGCLDHCQSTANANERKDNIIENTNNDINGEILENSDRDHDISYGDVINNRNQLSLINSGVDNLLLNSHKNDRPPNVNLPSRPINEDEANLDSIFANKENAHSEMLNEHYMQLRLKKDDKFPHGPRLFEAQKNMRIPVAGPRFLNRSNEVRHRSDVKNSNKSTAQRDTLQRRPRSVVLQNRKARNADVGVSGLYEVISEADLAFSPDSKQEAVTVFQGKISEEIVYGICMPVTGFSMFFIVIVSATIISALIAGSLLYRYQLQKEAVEKHSPLSPGTLTSWMTLKLFRLRQQQRLQDQCDNRQQHQHLEQQHSHQHMMHGNEKKVSQ